MSSETSKLSIDLLTNKIPVLKVEAIQLIGRLFCIHHILINHESGTLGVVRDSLPDLSIISINLKSLAASRALYLPDGTKFAKEFEQFFRSHIIAVEVHGVLASPIPILVMKGVRVVLDLKFFTKSAL